VDLLRPARRCGVGQDGAIIDHHSFSYSRLYRMILQVAGTIAKFNCAISSYLDEKYNPKHLGKT